MNGDSNVPFGTPPVGFMQTGNQPFEMESNVENTPAEIVEQHSNIVGQEGIDPFASAPQSTDFTPTQTTKYKIVDLFWLINPKFYANPKQQPVQNEAHFVILSFNLDFGNMRVSFFNLTNNSVQGNILYLENCKRTVTGTIYPATCFNAFHSPRLSTTCLEQLFRQIPGANWQQERPVCTIQKNEEKIRFTVKDPKFGEHFYDFVSWQREAFLHACNFAFTKGFEILAQSK
jgi:hypothetical protein